MPLRELTDEDVTFLAGDTGLEPQRILWLRDSATLEEETKLVDPAIHTHASYRRLPSAVFYSWFRQNIPTELEVLLDQDETTLRRALEASVGSNIIPAQLQENNDLIFAHWHEFTLQRRLQLAPEGGHASLGDLLVTMPQPLGRDQQAVVAAVVGAVRVDDEQFSERLQAAGLSHEQVVGVQRTLRLGDLTLQHAPLVQSLQELANQTEDTTLRSLAALRQDQWLDLAYTHGTPAGSNLAEDAYAKQLETKIEERHPTAVLASRLNDGALRIERPGFAEVGTFLKANPTFDILTANIETFSAEARFDGIEHTGEVLTALQQLQRVKALSTTWQESAVLVNVGVESTLHVVELGRDRLEKVVEGRSRRIGSTRSTRPRVRRTTPPSR